MLDKGERKVVILKITKMLMKGVKEEEVAQFEFVTEIGLVLTKKTMFKKFLELFTGGLHFCVYLNKKLLKSIARMSY